MERIEHGNRANRTVVDDQICVKRFRGLDTDICEMPRQKFSPAVALATFTGSYILDFLEKDDGLEEQFSARLCLFRDA